MDANQSISSDDWKSIILQVSPVQASSLALRVLLVLPLTGRDFWSRTSAAEPTTSVKHSMQISIDCLRDPVGPAWRCYTCSARRGFRPTFFCHNFYHM